MEERIPCGDSGYALNYGKRYCEAFEQCDGLYTTEGVSWIAGVRSCLMKDILNSEGYINKGTCEALKTFAFNSHPRCYVDHGFCQHILLDGKNLRAVYNIIATYPPGSASNIRLSLDQVMKTSLMCTQRGVAEVQNAVAGTIVNATGGYLDYLQELKDMFSIQCYRDIDVLFLMDSSGSVGKENYAIMKDFVANVILSFNVTQNSRIGIVIFDSTPTTVVPLATATNINALATRVRNIPYFGGGTRTDYALNTALNVLSLHNRLRIGILLSDGVSNEPELTVTASNEVHEAGIKMYTFGIGNTNVQELKQIASDPDSDYSFYISSFTSSNFNEQLLLLATQTCSTPQVGYYNEETNHEVNEGDRTYIEYPFQEAGITIEIRVDSGSVEVYGSFLVRNPGKTTADFSFTASASFSYYISSSDLETATGIPLPSRTKRESTNQTASEYMVHLSVVGQPASSSFSIETVTGNTVPSTAETTPTSLTREEIYKIAIICLSVALSATIISCIISCICCCHWFRKSDNNPCK
jgi:Mg-chelatase subunit ChlD